MSKINQIETSTIFSYSKTTSIDSPLKGKKKVFFSFSLFFFIIFEDRGIKL